jgi:hypothetical protein
MRAPICVTCQVQMRCQKTGVDVELMAGDMPYQIWSADLFACEKCGISVISGFGNRPVAEHFQADRYMNFVSGVTLRFWDNLTDKRFWGELKDRQDSLRKMAQE